MPEIIFNDGSVSIILKLGKLYARYDDGGIVVHMVEHEITKEESEKIQKGPQDAYEVLLALQKRSLPK